MARFIPDNDAIRMEITMILLYKYMESVSGNCKSGKDSTPGRTASAVFTSSSYMLLVIFDWNEILNPFTSKESGTVKKGTTGHPLPPLYSPITLYVFPNNSIVFLLFWILKVGVFHPDPSLATSATYAPDASSSFVKYLPLRRIPFFS